MKWLNIAFGFVFMTYSGAIASDVVFTTEHNDAREKKVIEMLQTFEAEHDVTRWMFTDKVHINYESIPHSHPVLTIHTRHLKRPDNLYATYLHEQHDW